MRPKGAEPESDEMCRVLEESLERSVASRLRLPFAFDAAALASETHAFDESVWIAHFNRAYYEGDWSGLPLRTPHGRLTLFPDVTGTAPYLDTPYLDRCPTIRAGLAALGCETKSVRLLRLGAGARVLEHQDYNIGLDYGFVRLHVPVVTGPGVEFILGGEPLVMAAGECWYVDVWNVHCVMNPGPAARIHLVVDCIVDPPFLAMMNAALAPAS